MPVMKKLLDLLDELKEENPELSNRAALAAATLQAGLEEQQEEEEEFDDSYIIIKEHDTERIMEVEKSLDNLLYQFGLLVRNQEVSRNNALEKIEEIRESKESILNSYKEQYRCDPEAEYAIKFQDDNKMNLVFVKKQD
tara:strand:+ start:80 stop:496 length:417 start_codon:yes stop_codon:yes gene_type:complete